MDDTERLRTLVEFSFDAYWETDAQHRFTRQDYSEKLADAPASGARLPDLSTRGARRHPPSWRNAAAAVARPPR